jgi:ParB family transcriptional regulator, chromosome partitioning protein
VRPSAATSNCLGRVSKALILEAVTEGVSPNAAANLACLKKGDMATTAEERLAGKGWLPAV